MKNLGGGILGLSGIQTKHCMKDQGNADEGNFRGQGKMV